MKAQQNHHNDKTYEAKQSKCQTHPFCVGQLINILVNKTYPKYPDPNNNTTAQIYAGCRQETKKRVIVSTANTVIQIFTVVIHVLRTTATCPAMVTENLYRSVTGLTAFNQIWILFMLILIIALILSSLFVDILPIVLYFFVFPNFYQFGILQQPIRRIPTSKYKVVNDHANESHNQNGPDKVQKWVIDGKYGSDHENAVQGQLHDHGNDSYYLFQRGLMGIRVDFLISVDFWLGQLLRDFEFGDWCGGKHQVSLTITYRLLLNINLSTICQYSQNECKQNNQYYTMTTLNNAANRIAKLKLMKDLKYGKVHLRQSLLEMSEFEDIQRMFKGRKQFYSIQDLDVNLEKIVTEDNEEEANILISPVQRLELFRKEKMNKKLKEKMAQGVWVKQMKNSRPRVPKTSKMLEKFQEKYKNQMHISYKEQLRESQLNLEKIKKNDKTRFQVNSQNQKPLYQSRIFMNTPEKQTSEQGSRKRFMSLKTSLPEREKFVYRSIRQIMQGKLKQNIKGPIIDIKSLQNALDNYLNQSLKRMRIRVQREIQPRNSNTASPSKHYHHAAQNRVSSRLQQRKKVKSNIDRSFNRSEQSSKKMIDTMSDFYQTKHQKKDSFDQMVKNLKYDRPLTSSIRRRNYTVVGKETLNPIQDYRDISEQQRRKIRSQNHAFYCKLIQGLQNYHQQDIPATVYIVEEVKRIFQTEYILTQEILKELIQTVNGMKIDHKTEDILKKLAAFVGISLSFTPNQSEMH